MQSKYLLLETIDYPSDLRKLSLNQLPKVCDELRNYIIETVLTHGGHFAANLGVVELTVALHYVFNTPDDRLVWDVGHQAYGHKILTGRRKNFHTNRKMGGLSGFPNINESEFDAFGTGHSSTAISAVLGMAVASKLDGKKYKKHIAVVGDGALTAGQAYEGLNNLSVSGTNTLLILNDNNIGIDPNTGAINRHFNTINPKNNLFTNLGLTYFGPIYGHDILNLVAQLETLKKETKPCVLHIKTIKGKGFAEAEKEQTKWHSTSKFIKIENPETKPVNNKLKYQDVFGLTIKELAEKNKNITGVTPAMPTGSGMLKAMEAFPDRFFDVGIAEQHAVTFAAGLAKEGYVVFCSIYSTFLQRALDQIIHDVCIQNLPVIFCIDRAGNVGDDGPTHHGMFDIAMLRALPNITIAAPSTGNELRKMMHYYSKHAKGPVAVRYPKGFIHGKEIDWTLPPKATEPAIELVSEGVNVAILSFGTMLQNCKEAKKLLKPEEINVAIFDMKLAKPMDYSMLNEIFENYSCLITIEDGSIIGGFGNAINDYNNKSGTRAVIENLGFPDKVIEHGTTEELFSKYGLDAKGIADSVMRNMS
ncbi:MAG: 1-deoxy-D-xylulose-5-phosphate synthase [Bacteroidia bacterium]